MTFIKRMAGLFALTALIMTAFTADAHAYIDTSTGSYILQVLLAGLMGIMLTLKVFWKQIKNYFSRNKEISSESEEKTD